MCVVFEVDLNDITPMEMVSKAAQKVHKLPANMHYRPILGWILGFSDFFNNGTGSSWSETPPQRAPATSSKGFLTGETSFKPSLTSCTLFLSDRVSV